ncbi:MAG TPA: M20/M25/M40 family metallo-hydrolase, partial [Nevskiaceae bacterium]|nr:M20/M25/M40 family metallo-hydrolase [Nevskiaceae bacterium]
SGSVQAQAAVHQVADALQTLGLNVGMIPVQVPHWVRGGADAAIVRYTGQPSGVHQPLVVTALGNSPATPAEGLTAPVLIVDSYDALQAHAQQVAGHIVLFNVPFNQQLADAGYGATAYARVLDYRLHGPAAAARLGAVAALVRDASGAKARLPHTGSTVWPEGITQIPAASITAEDCDLVAALAAKGPVDVHLLLTPRTLPPVKSSDVIGDLRGTVHPDQVVVVSGHLDSWDLGTGAQDDGAGVAVAMGVAAVLHQLDLHPRRTLRVVAWADEENGLAGARAYRQAMAASINQHVAAIENDTGAGRPFGIAAQITPDSMSLLSPVFDALARMGVTILTRSLQPVASDIAPLDDAGVPGFAPIVDMREYFDIHHSAADTLDKVKPENLRRQVAVDAVLAWWLANADPLPRIPAVVYASDLRHSD